MKKIILISLLILLSIVLEAQEFEISPYLKESLLMKKELKNKFYYEAIYSYYENFNILNGIPNLPFLDHSLSTNNLKIRIKEFELTNLDISISLYIKIYF